MDNSLQSKAIKNLIKTSLSHIKDIISYNIKIIMGDEIINFSFYNKRIKVLEDSYVVYIHTNQNKII